MSANTFRHASNADAGPSLTPSRPAPPIPRPSGLGRIAHGALNASHEMRQQTPGATAAGQLFAQTSSKPTAFAVEQAGSAQTIVKRGWVNVKEEGLRAWIWSKRWLVLREETLTFYKNEVSLRHKSH